MKEITRRDFVALSASSSLAVVVGWPARRKASAGPSIFWTDTPAGGLRSVYDVRMAVRSGKSAAMYATIRELVERDLQQPPISPSDPIPGRDEASVRNNSPDFIVTHEAGQRMLRAALVAVLEDDGAFRDVALEQMETLFNRDIWEGWIDKSHLRFGHPAGLRTGMLSEAVSLSYDWLGAYLSDSERTMIIEGLDRCAIQPFLVSMKQDAWWLKDQNNWLTTIVGGLGMAGMVLGDKHPESEFLVSYAVSRMEEYLAIYGPDGEFNESVHYANATLRPVSFFQAYRYKTRGGDNRLAQPPFPQTCLWQLYMTLPPGRVAAFGDSQLEAAPWTRHIAAVAAATEDPVLQWFYLKNSGEGGDPIELLWYDAGLQPQSPVDRLPRGRSFPSHGGCFASRSDWDAETAACIVYGKAGREENHEHNDVGQICIDANGERLIVDLGSPKPTYPADFFDEGRYEYYNASVIGHNVLMFDNEELRYPTRDRGVPIGNLAKERSGRIREARFDDDLGAVWQVDLSPAYRDVKRISRTVIHLLPGFVAVLDRAELERESEASLRWHTIKPVTVDADGSFSLTTDSSVLSARTISLSGESQTQLRRHEYKAPFDKGRGGVQLDQHHEPYVEILARGTRFGFMTLFAVSDVSTEHGRWSIDPSVSQGWSITTGVDRCLVRLDDQVLTVTSSSGQRSLSARL